MMYQDHQGNVVHHFNIPGRHTRLTVTAEAVVDCAPLPDLPDALAPGAWERLDASAIGGVLGSAERQRVRPPHAATGSVVG